VSAAYTLTVVGHTPVLVEREQDIGTEPMILLRIGAVVLRVSPDVSRQLADGIIEVDVDEPAPVYLT
jgi:hypothetical protein